ncbi:CUB domain-containing protein [Ditylenchus destructor]|nr:CUB domain-containing protein [Ditylenchus destructor]
MCNKLLHTSITVNNVNAACPDGYTLSNTNQKCYQVLGTDYKHDDAKTQCASAGGGHLPIIKSVNDNNAVVEVWQADANKKGIQPWIGLTCASGAKQEDCNWDVNSETSDYRNFDSSLYNPAGLGLCVVFVKNAASKTWASNDCDDARAVICEVAETTTCSTPFKRVSGGGCWLLSETKENITSAQSKCAQNNGVLMSVHDQNANNQLKTQVQTDYPADSSVWLGAKIDSYSNQFQWLDNSALDYTNFKIVGSSASGQCPQNKYFADTGEIQSPGFPSFYGNNLNCEYHINMDVRKFVKITTEEFSLRQGDVIELYDGEMSDTPFQTLQSATGTNKIYTTTKSNLLRLRFTSQANGQGDTSSIKGWKLKYEPVGSRPSNRGTGGNNNEDVTDIPWPDTGDYTKTAANVCPQGTYTTQAGKISSSGFADENDSQSHYGNQLNCTYTISVDEGQRVELRFARFNTEACCDFVEAFDGATVGDRLLTSHSGHAIPKNTIRSNGRYLTVRFTTDSLINEPGWGAEYRALPKS